MCALAIINVVVLLEEANGFGYPVCLTMSSLCVCLQGSFYNGLLYTAQAVRRFHQMYLLDITHALMMLFNKCISWILLML
jgi:hypothetical protein